MNEIIIKTQIIMSLTGLAHHLCLNEFPERIFGMLGDDPRRAEKIVHGIAKEYICNAEANVAIKTLEYSYVDSPDIRYAMVYFTAVLSGTARELLKVVGEEHHLFKADK